MADSKQLIGLQSTLSLQIDTETVIRAEREVQSLKVLVAEMVIFWTNRDRAESCLRYVIKG